MEVIYKYKVIQNNHIVLKDNNSFNLINLENMELSPIVQYERDISYSSYRHNEFWKDKDKLHYCIVNENYDDNNTYLNLYISCE